MSLHSNNPPGLGLWDKNGQLGHLSCAVGCTDMAEHRRLKPLLLSAGILVLGMYFNCCMQGQ